MPGKIYKIISGVRQGQVVFVDNKQDEQVLKLGKLHGYFFTSVNYDNDYDAVLNDGKHQKGLVAKERLEPIGFYD